MIYQIAIGVKYTHIYETRKKTMNALRKMKFTEELLVNPEIA